MLGIPYKANGYDLQYVKDLLKQLANIGAKKVVLKGIVFDETQPEVGDVKGKIGIIAYDKESDSFSWYFHEKMSQSFHGTGDIFASVFTGAMVRGKSFKESYSLAANFVVESIKATLAHDDHNTYGVDFETAIPYLVKNL